MAVEYAFLVLYNVYLAICGVYFAHYGISGDEATSFAYLQHLTKVPRFQMVNMFMSSEEKQGAMQTTCTCILLCGILLLARGHLRIYVKKYYCRTGAEFYNFLFTH